MSLQQGEEKTASKPIPVQRFTWILIIIWTVFIAWLSADEISGIRRMTREMAVGEIRAYFNKDRALRIWGASHGGVYVPVDERTPSSPYLAHVPERDIETPSGKKLTLMNPAYMMRQVSDDFSNLYGVVARTTSLSPLRPQNAPDEWERVALEDFESQSIQEKLEFSPVNGIPHLRLIQPVIVKKQCLRCHGHQGYSIGDIRGGISIGLPMVDSLAIESKQVNSHMIRAASIWLIGVVGLALGGSILSHRIAERDEAQDKLRRSMTRLAAKSKELAAANRALSTEVVARKAAQDRILKSEEKFRTVADFTYDWEYWLDPVGGYEYMSPSSKRITGYTPEEFKNNPNLFMEIVHPDHKTQVKDHLLNSMEEHEVCMLEFRIITRDCKERWLAHTCQPVYDDKGKFAGRRASNRDVTGRKWAEKALEKFAMDLAHSNKDLQDFAYMASHDLREPLVLIQAFSERLRKRCGDDLNERGHEYVKRIESSAVRMMDLISGILTYSRVTTTGNPFEVIDLNKIIREVLFDLEMRFKETWGSVDIQRLGVIKADPLQVRQLLQNLVANALKYHRPDVPPAIKIHGQPQALRDDSGATYFYQLVVEDNGIGFEEHEEGQIFGLFQRLHGRSKYEGTGIGLAVCKRIVDRHGGMISAESTPGQGSKFIVTLPVNGPEMNEQQPILSDEQAKKACKHLLEIDLDPTPESLSKYPSSRT